MTTEGAPERGQDIPTEYPYTFVMHGRHLDAQQIADYVAQHGLYPLRFGGHPKVLVYEVDVPSKMMRVHSHTSPQEFVALGMELGTWPGEPGTPPPPQPPPPPPPGDEVDGVWSARKERDLRAWALRVDERQAKTDERQERQDERLTRLGG